MGVYLIGDYSQCWIGPWWSLVQPRKGFLKLLDGHLGAFQTEVVLRQLGAHLEPKACEPLESFRKQDPVVSSCHLGSKGSFASCP